MRIRIRARGMRIAVTGLLLLAVVAPPALAITVTGGPFGDRIIGTDDADTLDGGGGESLIFGKRGDDVLRGGDSFESHRLFPGDGSDNVDGDGARDVILDEDDDRDVLRAHGEVDSIYSANNEGQRDVIDCGDDFDFAFADRSDQLTNCEFVVRATVRGPDPTGFLTPGEDFLIGTNDAEELDGGAAADRLFGKRGDDTLIGGPGSDLLFPGDGKDTVLGGPGSDVLHDDDDDEDVLAGDDSFSAGAGPDTIYSANDESDRDRIDCGPGEDIVYADSRDIVSADCENVFRDTQIAGP